MIRYSCKVPSNFNQFYADSNCSKDFTKAPDMKCHINLSRGMPYYRQMDVWTNSLTSFQSKRAVVWQFHVARNN